MDSSESLRDSHLVYTYAQLVASTNLSGGTVDATQIGVGGVLVVDSNGAWVGPTIAVNWSDINGYPATLQMVTRDTQLSEAGKTFVTNGSIDLANQSKMGGDTLVTVATKPCAPRHLMRQR